MHGARGGGYRSGSGSLHAGHAPAHQPRSIRGREMEAALVKLSRAHSRATLLMGLDSRLWSDVSLAGAAAEERAGAEA